MTAKQDTPIEPQSNGAADAAAALEALNQAQSIVSAPGSSNEANLPPVKFPRLSLHRRVLGTITDDG